MSEPQRRTHLGIFPKGIHTFLLNPNTSETHTLARRIATEGFQEVSFIVRAHSGTIGMGSQIQFRVLADGFSAEDPTLAFTSQIDVSGTNVTFVSTTTFPTVSTLSLTPAAGSSSGAYLALQLTASRGTPLVALILEYSVDLVLKGGTHPQRRDTRPFRGYRLER